jgi:Tol biopolymer transport system component
VLEPVPGNGGPIHVINADGSGDVPLTSDSSAEFTPDWSPTGDRIVFRDNGSQFEGRGIYTMRPDGSDITPVPGTANDYTPAWSPDGSRIAVQKTGGGIDTIALDGSDRITVVGGSTNPPDWQPVTTPVPGYARPKGRLRSKSPWCPATGPVILPIVSTPRRSRPVPAARRSRGPTS